jgi:hypothetical protein
VTFRRLLDRRVTVRGRIVVGKDDRNDDVLGPGPEHVDVPAARELEGADEQTDDRDAQERRFVYLIPARHRGTMLSIDGYSEVDDGDETFSVVGEPELVVRRRGGRPHHFELLVERRS